MADGRWLMTDVPRNLENRPSAIGHQPSAIGHRPSAIPEAEPPETPDERRPSGGLSRNHPGMGKGSFGETTPAARSKTGAHPAAEVRDFTPRRGQSGARAQ